MVTSLTRWFVAICLVWQVEASCQHRGQHWLSACNTTANTSQTCPSGCLNAYNFFRLACGNTTWNETANGGFKQIMEGTHDKATLARWEQASGSNWNGTFGSVSFLTYVVLGTLQFRVRLLPPYTLSSRVVATHFANCIRLIQEYVGNVGIC